MRLMILLLLVATCQAQDIPPDPEMDTDIHPVVFPDQMEQATKIITDAARDILGEELAWKLGIKDFLENNSTRLNYTEFRA